MTRDGRGKPRDASDSEDGGFTLVELLVGSLLSLLVVALVPSVIEATSNATNSSQALATGTTQARLALQDLQIEVGSARQLCLVTTLTTSGPTVSPGYAVRVESLAYGRTTWDQWMLDTATHQLLEQRWPASWTAASPVPPFVVVASDIVNPAPSVPFALPAVAHGAPLNLIVSLSVNDGTRASGPPVQIRTTIAALSTPYDSKPTCRSAED